MRQLDPSGLPQHRLRLFRAAYALCGSREDAEDLVQETFVRVMRRPRLLHGEDDLVYLGKVLRNTWFNECRARRRRPQTVDFEDGVDWLLDERSDPLTTLAELTAIYAAIASLPQHLRETIVAVDILDLSYKQAASALQAPIGTIMSRLHRARDKVARQLEVAERSARDPACCQRPRHAPVSGPRAA